MMATVLPAPPATVCNDAYHPATPGIQQQHTLVSSLRTFFLQFDRDAIQHSVCTWRSAAPLERQQALPGKLVDAVRPSCSISSCVLLYSCTAKHNCHHIGVQSFHCAQFVQLAVRSLHDEQRQQHNG